MRIYKQVGCGVQKRLRARSNFPTIPFGLPTQIFRTAVKKPLIIVTTVSAVLLVVVLWIQCASTPIPMQQLLASSWLQRKPKLPWPFGPSPARSTAAPIAGTDLNSSDFDKFRLDSVCPVILQEQSTAIRVKCESDNNVTALSPEQYLNKSCSEIRLPYLLDRDSLPADELNMSVAFGILMYKDVWQVERLLRAIYRPHHSYCVHIDNKTEPTVAHAMQRIASCFDNVFVPIDNMDVHYAQIAQVDAELLCMRELLRRSDKWSWYINLTGQEFPLKTMWQLVRILKALNYTNSVSVGADDWAVPTRKTPMRKFTDPYNMTPSSGATHIIVVRGFAQFATSAKLAKDFRDHLVGSSTPDETFFNTLNNSPVLGIPGAATVRNAPEGTVGFINRWKQFKGGQNPPCLSNHYVHNVCIYGVADLPHITNSSRAQLFVNKLHWDFQHLALDCLEWWYYRNTMIEYADYRIKKADGLPVDLQYYEKYSTQFRPRT